MFTIEVPSGCFTAAANEQLDPDGRPEQVSAVTWLNPFIGVIRNATSTLCPGLVVTVDGVASTVKSGPTIFIWIAGEFEAAKDPFPT